MVTVMLNVSVYICLPASACFSLFVYFCLCLSLMKKAIRSPMSTEAVHYIMFLNLTRKHTSRKIDVSKTRTANHIVTTQNHLHHNAIDHPNCLQTREMETIYTLEYTPDMTFAVDWALNNNYLSIYLIYATHLRRRCHDM